MKLLLGALLIGIAAPIGAAPMALERLLAPKLSLVDARFEVFDAKSSTVVDHGVWAQFLHSYVVPGSDGINRVRYRTVSTADRASLDAYIGRLEGVDVAALARSEQIAFWFNLYNAATIRLILDNADVGSIREIEQPWDTPVASVAGRALTLNEIEHGIIRPIARDPRIHYAVNCASLGCPNLVRAAFTGANLDAQLDLAARDYVNHPRGVTVTGGRITASKIFGWYRDDFGKDDAAVLEHVRRYAAPALAESLAGKRRISAYQYDWALNAAAGVE